MKHILFVVLFGSVSAFAGVMNGGGGKGVVCKDAQGAVASVELLDLWEARTLFEEVPVLPLPKDTAAAVAVVLDQLKISYPYYGENASPGNECKNEGCLLQMLARQANLFLTPNKNIVRLRNVTLELTDDSYEVARPSNCEIQQIINYQSGKIWVNQDLYEKLNPTNQVALIAHEAYYALLRNIAKETTSIRTRRAVGYVMSGNHFVLTPWTPVPSGALFCANEGVPYAPTSLYITWNPPNMVPDISKMMIHSIESMGSRYIGVSRLDWHPVGASQRVIKAITTGQCDDDGILFGYSSQMDGPVEFDRNPQLGFTCKDKKVIAYFNDPRAGDTDAPSILLNCSIRL